jgi:predicted transcriptional regulator of viral defense system
MSLYRNIMKFIDFQNQLANYLIFSLQDVRKVIGDFSYRQLDRWEKKSYLKKIKQGFYCFATQSVDRNFLFYTANRIYAPSYISLEIALKFYSLIPEEIFQITSVSTKKTVDFKTDIGNFTYRHIKPSLYFGYRLVDFGRQKILLADPEKAILDYLYLHPNLKRAADFVEMRINSDELKAQINLKKFEKYLAAFENKSLTRRAKIFLTTTHE